MVLKFRDMTTMKEKLSCRGDTTFSCDKIRRVTSKHRQKIKKKY